SNTPTACPNASIVLTGTNSGGTPAYTYTWSGGPAANAFTVTHNTAGTYVYTLNSSDANNCLTSNTISVVFVPKPVLSTSNVSICPLAVGVLTVSGATSYTWSNGLTGSMISDNPVSTKIYTILASALGCTASISASIILFPLPVPVFNSNS